MKNDYLKDVLIRSLELYTALEGVKVTMDIFPTEDHKKCADKRLEIAENYLKELKSGE